MISWDQISLSNHIDKNNFTSIPFVGKISNEGYATILPDFSMEPLFAKGSLLIFDPQKNYKDRSYVMVKLDESKYPVFRQLLIDLEVKYLKPLNPDLKDFKMRKIGEKDKIIGTLIEARQMYDEN